MTLLVNGIRYREGRRWDLAAFLLRWIISTGAGMRGKRAPKITTKGLLGRASMAEQIDKLMGFDSAVEDLKQFAKDRATAILTRHAQAKKKKLAAKKKKG